ncbi:MAG: EscN/YscN/HrcN family type III secretion system ATPase [Candidatus Eremiobacteraeota bacterium]|nr:EscN/YscN/HrcN family type III secretion system ATPase [Candidatus Eremiobacteraeota bacterium]
MIGRPVGAVVAARGQLIEAELPFVRVGDGVRVCARDRAVSARVAALQGTRALLAPLGALDGVAGGDRVEADPAVLAFPFGTPLLGRAIDAAGNPLDGRPVPRGRRLAVAAQAPPLAERRPCTEPFVTGVRAIDGPLAFGRGARIGVFGAPGAGKSSLLDAIGRGAEADAVVVGLIGERGREAERRVAALGARTTIVCATGDRPPAERVRAAEVAFAQAGALRARGLHVLLVVDSLARICAAARETALAAGEPAGRGGYPPSVFALLARLLERAGAAARGSVTLVATVLSDGPDEHDPVSEAARAALDGHLVLSTRLARAGRFPAIDLVRSASRTLAEAVSPEHLAAARALRAAAAALEESRDARALGLGTADPFLSRCVALEDALEGFLRQGPEPSAARETLTRMLALADSLE